MKKIVNTSNAPKPIGPYNQAVISGNLMFMSGQIAFNPSTGGISYWRNSGWDKASYGKFKINSWWSRPFF